MTLIRVVTAAPEDIDALGHVNNTVWVRWIQDVATAHWDADATPAQIAAYYWVIVRHEIDYRGNLKAGESAQATTWVGDTAVGAKLDRYVEFTRDGRTLVSAKTTWAIIGRATHRILRVPRDVMDRFAPKGRE